MQKKFIKNITFLVLAFVLVYVLCSIPYEFLFLNADSVLLTKNELMALKNEKFNGVVYGDIIQLRADEERERKLDEYSVNFKLFNLFSIKNLRVKVDNSNGVYVGGNCIGISLKSNGVVVVGSNFIITKNGTSHPFKESGLKVGYILTHINDNEINSLQDITNYLKSYKKEDVVLKIIRNENNLELKITPALDAQTNTYKLGVWIRDDAVGVGTLTYVKESNLGYGALGHAVVDKDSGVKFNVKDGEIYKCNVVGVKKGKKGIPGELMGLFMYGAENKLGSVEKNTNEGIFGEFSNNEFLIGKKKYEIGGRMTAKPGKAKILSTVNGVDVLEYDIEIIKTNFQNSANEKSMVIKITDDKLLEKTGGIVQGMSGSPIIQNGKIIGAVTHVFVNDPTKGFGLYLDWMIKN